MVELEHVLWLFPDATWLADAVLKRRGFPTTAEQSAMAVRASYQANYDFVMGNRENMEANEEIASGIGYPDALRDLDLLAQDPKKFDVVKELNAVKGEYNELLSKMQKASPKYINLLWQVYRRFGYVIECHQLFKTTIEDIFNPPIEENRRIKAKYEYVIPSPETDDERVNHLFEWKLSSDKHQALNTEPLYRFVEFDADYFYRTGRFAFALASGLGKGNIFQTIWDSRQQEVPFFKIS